jgi:hypothetical protein
MVKRIPLWLIQVNLFYVMASENKKKKAKNSYLANANKTTDKLKRINFYNKINRAENKCKVKDC